MSSFGQYEEQTGIANNVDWREPMAKKTTTRKRVSRESNAMRANPFKPILVVVGESMVDPDDVAAIKKIRSKTDLYIVILKSQPNMEYPLWASAAEVATLMEHFHIVG